MGVAHTYKVPAIMTPLHPFHKFYKFHLYTDSGFYKQSTAAPRSYEALLLSPLPVKRYWILSPDMDEQTGFSLAPARLLTADSRFPSIESFDAPDTIRRGFSVIFLQPEKYPQIYIKSHVWQPLFLPLDS